MNLYFDSAYIGKCYFHEPDGLEVRQVARNGTIYSSAICIAEVGCEMHRKVREGMLSPSLALELRNQFLDDMHAEVWGLIPVTNRLLLQAESFTRHLPPQVYIRAGDAIHLVSAMEHGFREIWTNDRHLLAAAPHAGLRGRSVA